MEEIIKEFVRDICSVGWHPKSTVRRRVDELLKTQRKDLLRQIDKVKAPRMTEKSFDNLPNKKGIWYAGFSTAKKRIKQLLK